MGSMGYIYYDLLDIKLLWGSAISNSGKTVGYIMELRDIFHGIFGMILWDIDWNYGRVIWENYGRIMGELNGYGRITVGYIMELWENSMRELWENYGTSIWDNYGI